MDYVYNGKGIPELQEPLALRRILFQLEIIAGTPLDHEEPSLVRRVRVCLGLLHMHDEMIRCAIKIFAPDSGDHPHYEYKKINSVHKEGTIVQCIRAYTWCENVRITKGTERQLFRYNEAMEGDAMSIISQEECVARPDDSTLSGRSYSFIACSPHGNTLGDYYYTKPMPLVILYCGIMDTLRGLQTLRSRGFIHRDIKPTNIFMKNPDAILMDTGLVVGDCFLNTPSAIIEARPHFVLGDFESLESVGDLSLTEVKFYRTPLNGTYPFMARSCFQQTEKTAENLWKDDLESLGYSLLFCLKGELPWPMESRAKDPVVESELIDFVTTEQDISALEAREECFRSGFDHPVVNEYFDILESYEEGIVTEDVYDRLISMLQHYAEIL